MPNGQPRWKYLFGFVLAAACLGWAQADSWAIPPSADEAAETLQLAVAGHEEAAWLIVGRPDGQKDVFVYRFARMDISQARPEPVVSISPQRGTMQRWAAVGDALHVFYAADAVFTEQGAHYRYDGDRAGARARLPGPVLPLAVAGAQGNDQPVLWAVVQAPTAAEVEAQWREALEMPLLGVGPQTTSEPFASETESLLTAPPVVQAPEDGPQDEPPDPSTLHLVQFDGLLWEPGRAGPAESAEADRVWLAVGGENQFHLLWQGRQKTDTLRYARWDPAQEQWREAAPLAIGLKSEPVFVGLVNRNLIVALQVPAAGDAGQWHCRLRTFATDESSDASGSWRSLPPLLVSAEEGAEELSLPAGAAVGGFADKLVLLRAAGEGPEVALYQPLAGGGPVQDFQEVPLARQGTISPSERGWRDLAAMVAVVALLLLVFWRRQEAVLGPTPLPEGIEAVRPGKRIAAAVLDMVPAAVVVGIIWYEPLAAFGRAFWPAFSSGRAELFEQVPRPEALAWAGVWFRILFAGYGMVCEQLWQATPGKRLLGCEVRMETYAPARGVPIVIRNITKLVELEPFLQIWPFVLVIFFTRHHQRLGDLLARTIVVERQAEIFPADEGRSPSNEAE